MKKTAFFILTALTLIATLFSCKDQETYAEMKDKEKRYIAEFINDNDITGPIKVITENEFYAQDSITDVSKNEYVVFGEDGIYMQIIRKGEGETMEEMAIKQPDSVITKNILCRFLEYDIESADTTVTNYGYPSYVDKMLVKCTTYRNSNGTLNNTYTASYTEGMMFKLYKSASVPKGWLKPLSYIRLTKDSGKIAKVRLIVPHASGTSNASGYVLPCYYEITYQLGR